jgi:hypothetical protein
MKPLAIFAGVVAVGLVVIVGGLRLTDKSASATPSVTPPKPLTHAQFVRAANAVCVRYYHEDSTIYRHPKTLRALTRDLRISVPALDREVAGLRPLLPPPSDAGTYRRLLRGVAKLQRGAHVVLHAFNTRQYRRGVLAARTLGYLDRHLNSLANRLGLNLCGLSGQQVKARYSKGR